MKIISIGTDRNIFDPKSAVRVRAEEYATLFDELHIIVFTKRIKNQELRIKIGSNLYIYPTNSFHKLFYIRDAFKISKSIILNSKFLIHNSVITTQDPFETGIVGAKLKRKFGLKLHVQVHTDIFSPYFSELSILNRIRVRIARKILPGADAVRAVSQRVKKSLEKEVKLKSEPSVLPIFVDIEAYANAEVKTDLKRKYPQFNFILLIASRLTKEKNIPLAISVVEKLISSYPKLGLVIVGDGPEKDSLIQKVKSLDLSSNVVFENWTDDIVSYYKTANMFLVTSWFEGYSMAIIEAAASHCLIVSTDVGIANEVLQKGVCPVNDEDCFTETIKYFMDGKEQNPNRVYDLSKVVLTDKTEYLTRYRNDIIRAIEAKTNEK